MPDPDDGRVALPEVLMTLVIEFLFFLEHAGPDEVAPEAGERMTHEIAYQLGRLEPHELEPLIAFIRQQATESGWPAERAFLEQLPGHLGWG